jgi:ribonuclease P protein component
VQREHRLRTSAEFSRVRELGGRGWAHRSLVLYAAANNLDSVRVGITVSRRVGKAVVRNRVRRRLREAMRARLARVRTGQDVLLMARPSAAQASWTELNAAVDQVLARARLLVATEHRRCTSDRG